MRPIMATDSSPAREGPRGLTNLLQPFRLSQAFATLWFGQAFSRLGDSILFVVLPIVVYDLSRSPLAMGFVLTAYSLPQVAMLPFAGVLADRLPRVALMLWADAFRMLGMALAAVLAADGVLHLGAIDVLAAVYGVMDAVFLPAYSAVRAQVFTPEIRNAANALTGIAQQVAALAGPALGGVVLALARPAWGFAADAFSFLVSIGSLLFLRIPPVAGLDGEDGEVGFLSGLREGIAAIRPNPWLWQTILAFALINICAGSAYAVLVPWFVRLRLHLPGADYGLAMTGMALGSLGVAVLFGRRRTWRHRGPLAYGGVAVQGAAVAALALTHLFPLVVALLATGAAGMMLFSLIWEGSLQELVPEASYGRVASIDMLGSFALLPAGYAAMGWFAGAVGGVTALWVSGGLTATLALAMLLSPPIRRFS